MDFGLVGEVTRRINELPDNITCVDTGLIRPQLVACYIIEQDGYAGIIETGTGNSVETILAVLKLKNIPPDKVLYVMPTHVHLDHAAGAGFLMQVFPNASLVIHPRGASHMINPEKLWKGASDVYGEDAMQRMYGGVVAVAEKRLIVADDGFELDLAGRHLLFLDTPGHARHHYSIYDERSEGFFTGDTFGMAYRELSMSTIPYIMPTTTPVQFDPKAWFLTLDRYLSYKPKRMFLTHYGMVQEVETLTRDLKKRIEHYVTIADSCVTRTDRLTAIQNEIEQSTLQELKKLGCPLPTPACKALLNMDFNLNAQGLEVWLHSRRM